MYAYVEWGYQCDKRYNDSLVCMDHQVFGCAEQHIYIKCYLLWQETAISWEMYSLSWHLEITFPKMVDSMQRASEIADWGQTQSVRDESYGFCFSYLQYNLISIVSLYSLSIYHSDIHLPLYMRLWRKKLANSGLPGFDVLLERLVRSKTKMFRYRLPSDPAHSLANVKTMHNWMAIVMLCAIRNHH